MPEDVTAKLAAFTPTGLDRDAVLFAAGKAAGRRSVWKWLAATLAVSNAVTLAALAWPKPSPVVIVEPPPAVQPEPENAPYGPPAPSSYLALLKDVDAGRTPALADGHSLPSPPLTPRSFHDPRYH
jgi:hypothetical protein